MEPKRSHIDPVQGHKPPSKLRETPKPKVAPHRKRTKLQTEASQYAYQQTLPKGQRGDLRYDEDSPFHPEYFNTLTEQQKPKIKERIMGALLNQLLAFVRTWLYGRPVYKTRTNEAGVVEFILNDKGDKIMNVPLTIFGRVLQLVGAFGLLSATVFGKTLGEWVPLFEDLLRLLGGL
jgi:hypothetical protein